MSEANVTTTPSAGTDRRLVGRENGRWTADGSSVGPACRADSVAKSRSASGTYWAGDIETRFPGPSARPLDDDNKQTEKEDETRSAASKCDGPCDLGGQGRLRAGHGQLL